MARKKVKNENEHLIITDLGNDQVLIRPEEGYRLYHTLTRKYYSEAVTDKGSVKYFKAVLEG